MLLRQLEWPPLKMIRVGATVSALGFACGSLATTAPRLWACYFVAAAGMGFVFPAFSALAANAMHASEQGATAGSIGAAQGMGAVIGPLAGTWYMPSIHACHSGGGSAVAAGRVMADTARSAGLTSTARKCAECVLMRIAHYF